MWMSMNLFAKSGWWYIKFSEATGADAILDRIVHDAYVIEIQYVEKKHGKSMVIQLELIKPIFMFVIKMY